MDKLRKDKKEIESIITKMIKDFEIEYDVTVDEIHLLCESIYNIQGNNSINKKVELEVRI